MKYVLVSTIIVLLLAATIRCEQEAYHELNLINRLNEFFGFDHNIFLLASSTDYTECIPVEKNNFTAQTVYVLDPNSDNDTEPATVRSTASKKTFLIVVTESLLFENNTSLWSKMKEIQRLDDNVKIGVFFVSNNLTSMEQLFRWSWAVGIVNIFSAFHTNIEDTASSFNIFRFDPFVKFDLINVTGSESLQDYFPGFIPNYHEHPLRFVQYRRALVDPLIELWDTVVRVFNASLSITFLDQDEYDTFHDINVDIRRNEITVSQDTRIYPHRTSRSVVVVPHARPHSDFLAYLQNTTWQLLFAYTFIAIVAAILVLTISAYVNTKKFLLFQCVADVINLLMNDNGSIRYEQLHPADVCVIVPLTFTGLIAVNGIFGVFQSYLIAPIYEHQINTIDELFKSPVVISEFGDYWANRTIELLETISTHDGWSDKVRSRSSIQLSKEIMSFNNSIAFNTYEFDVQVLLKVQQRLSLKAYHMIREPCLEETFLSFEVSKYFPFIEALNDIMHRFKSAGLMQKWLDDIDQYNVKTLWKGNRSVRTSNESNNGDSVIPTVVWCGWIGSVILFVCEILWNKVRLKFGALRTKLSMG